MKHFIKALTLLLSLTMALPVNALTAFAEGTEGTEETVVEEVTEEAETVEVDAEVAEEAEVEEVETFEFATMALAAPSTQAATMTSVEKTQSVSLDPDMFYRIFHLDAGRKYFSVAQIKEIIDLLAANNYTHLELAVGNDALRFVLDDMSVTANGKTYSSADVTTGISNGNKAYYNDSNGNYLNQSEMDTIIAYAKSKNVGIIPLVNTPGHMDAILDAMEYVGISKPAYNYSARTVDVTNTEAVNFTLALTEKYIEYFAGKGVQIFNIGCDEYANDKYTSGSMGFGNLISTGKYGSFVTFVNNMAAQVQNAGMVAMAFNDGFYFNNNKSSGTFDTNIAIAYWTSGWTNYTVRSASNLVSDGFKIINTNDGWYYVLGRATGGYSLESAKSAVSGTKVTSVSGSSNVTPAGSMACVWCDTPSAAYNKTELNNFKYLIETQAKSNPTQFTSVTQSNWKDVDVPVYEMSDDSNTVTINTSETKTILTSVTMTAAEVANIETDYVAYDVTINGGEYTGAASVSIPLSDNLKAAAKLTGFVVNSDNSITKVSGSKSEDGTKYTFKAPHFSTVGVMAEDAPVLPGTKNTVDIELVVGQTSETYTEASGAYSEGTGLDTNIATAVITPVSTAGKVTTTKITSTNNLTGKNVLLVNQNAAKTLGNASQNSGIAFDGTVANTDGKGAEIWTVTSADGGYYVQNDNGKYLTIGNGTAALSDTPVVLKLTYSNSRWEIAQTISTSGYNQESVSYSTLANNKTSWTKTDYYYKSGDNYYPVYAYRQGSVLSYRYYVGYSTNGSTPSSANIANRASNTNVNLYKYSTTANTYYLNNYGGGGTYAAGYTSGASSDPGSRWDIYSVTATEDVNSTTVQFTGVMAGTTSVVIGETLYNVTVKQKTVVDSVLVDATKTYTDATASTAKVVSGSEFVTVSSNGSTLTITGKAEGTAIVETTNCKYTITVNEEDLEGIKIAAYFWVTNYEVTANGSTSMEIEAKDCKGAAGRLISELVPMTGKNGNDNEDYWKATCHTYGNWQLKAGGSSSASGKTSDQSGVDTTFKYIRYYDGAWAYSVDGNTWTNITSTGDKQDRIDLYYMQSTNVTDEVTTDVKDWGVVPHTGYNSANFVLMDFSVKYESGEETPSSFPVSGKTNAFHCDPNDKNTVHQYNNGSSSTWYNNYRDIGMIRGVETGDYEIYMITVTPTSDTRSTQCASNANAATKYSYTGTEYVAWAESEDVITESGLTKYTSISGKYVCQTGGDPSVQGVEIFNRHGMKVTYYVRAKITEDALTVRYVDETTNTEFYNYGIVVNSGTTFKSTIGLNNNKAVVNGDVVNSLGKTQNVSSDLSTMPAIPAAYRYSDYTVTKLERSEDGKTATLYYSFNNTHSFVVDFGLPLHITTEKLGISGDWTSVSVSGAKYGSAAAKVGEGVTYTPASVIQGVEQLNLVLTGSGGSATHIIYLYPATTVYYEEGFATPEGFTGGGRIVGNQAVQEAGNSSDEYGYDAAYAAISTGNSQMSGTVKDQAAQFTFTGTGVDVYANCTADSGIALVTIKNAAGKFEKIAFVQTTTTSDLYNITGTQYGLPIYSNTGLAYGTHTVTIAHYSGGAVNLDGFRVYGTLAEEPEFYKNDLEDNPSFIELRNEVLTVANIADTDVTEEGEQVYALSEGTTAAILTNYSDTEKRASLLNDGPKNEIFVLPNETLTFKINTAREVQLGMKQVTGISANVNITVDGTGTNKTISSSIDMFYTIINKGAEAVHTVTIRNNGDGILSVTKIKVCDDPNTALVELTSEDIKNAMAEPEVPEVDPEPTPEPEPEVVYADAVLNITVKDTIGRTVANTALTYTGEEGEAHKFTAAEIKTAAVKAAEANGYAGKINSKVTTTEVTCGETKSVSYKGVFSKLLGLFKK